MGTTAEKLTYLNTTKQKIKDAINNIGGNITSETTFRQYVAALESIYQSMPKVSGSGTTLSLSPTLKGLMQIDLKGNTSQEGTPTPSYPQDIHNVSGNNNIVVCGKNLFDKNNANVLNAYLSSTKIESSNNTRTIYIPCNPNTTYTVSRIQGSRFRLGTTANTPTINEALVDYTYNDTATSLTIATSVNAKYLCAFIYHSSYDTQITLQDILDSLQIEYGSEATTYEAYNGTTYPINLPVENLFDKDNMSTLNAYINGTGKIVNDTQPSVLYIACKPNTSYAIQKPNQITQSSNRYRVGCCSSTPSIDTQLSKYNNLPNGTTDTIMIFETDSTANYLVFNFAGGAIREYQAVINGIQIEKGSKPNTYTPYGTTPIELNKIGTYQDYIYKENDKWYLHKEIGKVVLNGSEEWIASGKAIFTRITNAHCLSNKNADVGDGSIDYVICDNFAINGLGDMYTYGTTGITLFYMVNNPSEIRLTFGMGDISVNDFKTWLTTHNTIVYYEYETPTNTEITDTTLLSQLEAIYNAKSKNGTTNINQENNDLPFILDVSALLGSGS